MTIKQSIDGEPCQQCLLHTLAKNVCTVSVTPESEFEKGGNRNAMVSFEDSQCHHPDMDAGVQTLLWDIPTVA